MPTQEQYDKLHEELGAQYHASPRVIQYIRSSYYQKFKGEELPLAQAQMIKHCDKVLVEIMRTYRQVKIDVASLVLKDVTGLKQANSRKVQIQDEMRHILGFIDKVGFRKSIIGFLKRCSESEFKAIVTAEVK